MAEQANPQTQDQASGAETKPTASSTETNTGADFVRTSQLIVLSNLKHVRDELEVGVSKIATLSKEQRFKLSMEARAHSMLLNGSLSFGGPWEKEEKPPVDKRVQALRSMADVLGRDISKFPAKQYEALVKQTWKTTKALLDETLERPDAKKLLESLDAPPK